MRRDKQPVLYLSAAMVVTGSGRVQTKSGVQGTKEADFFLQCLASAFTDCLAKDTKRRER